MVKPRYAIEDTNQSIMERHLSETIKSLHSSITSDLTDRVPKTIRSDIFENVFLPFFYDGTNPYNINITHWANVASGNDRNTRIGFYLPVHILDENSHILFIVPPLYTEEALKPTTLHNSFSLQDMFERAKFYGTIKPKMMQDSFNLIFNNMMNILRGNDEDLIKRIITWNEIFTHYGKPSLFEFTPHLEQSSDIPSDTNSETQYEIEDL